MLGIFDYDELFRSNRVLAPILFSGFAVLVILILMNIFLAIIGDAFIVVSEQQRVAEPDGPLPRALLQEGPRHKFDRMPSTCRRAGCSTPRRR